MALTKIYGQSLALLTDLYQLTMAYGYWKAGAAERESVFQMTFRRNPFDGGYAVAAGLGPALEYLDSFAFSTDDLDYLAGLEGNDGSPLFEERFLGYLEDMRLEVRVDAVREGEVVFAHEPIVRVQGPIAQCQILETPILNLFNFPTLIATKSARICSAAAGAPVLEFGLRRAQGVDGALTAARAAFIGGAAGTSNLLAGKLFGIPVLGTHAHSWVMFFDDEETAFREYADALPNNCVFLVDTYDTARGIDRAIEVGRSLREQGHRLVGVRLDSGDLAHLSILARRKLDEAGFEDALIVASNDLDEHVIASLKEQGAQIGVWGVGTRLATAYDQPALGGVYKLAAIRGEDGAWDYRIKLSEQTAKVPTPGALQVRRSYRDGEMVGDVIFDAGGEPTPGAMFAPTNPAKGWPVPNETRQRDLLVPVFENGEVLEEARPLADVRTAALAELRRLNARSRRLLNPQEYPVGLDRVVSDRKLRLIAESRGLDEPVVVDKAG